LCNISQYQDNVNNKTAVYGKKLHADIQGGATAKNPQQTNVFTAAPSIQITVM
jgi:hypothetical protein